jgi:hypothetical protein
MGSAKEAGPVIKAISGRSKWQEGCAPWEGSRHTVPRRSSRSGHFLQDFFPTTKGELTAISVSLRRAVPQAFSGYQCPVALFAGGACRRRQKVSKEYARVVKDLARLLCRDAVKSLQIKGLEVQILPLEPIYQAANLSEIRMNTGNSVKMPIPAFIQILPKKFT